VWIEAQVSIKVTALRAALGSLTTIVYDATAGVNTPRPASAVRAIWIWPTTQATDPVNAAVGDLIIRFAEL
jgi:hypothetical protein